MPFSQGGSGSSGAPPPGPRQEEWTRQTYAAVRGDGDSRLSAPDAAGGADRWHAAAEGYVQPSLSPANAPSFARPGEKRPREQETLHAGRSFPEDEELEEMAQRLKTVFLGVTRRLAIFDPTRATMIIAGRPCQAAHTPIVAMLCDGPSRPSQGVVALG